MDPHRLWQCPELQTGEGCRKLPFRLVLFWIFPGICSQPELEISTGAALEITHNPATLPCAALSLAEGVPSPALPRPLSHRVGLLRPQHILQRLTCC